jgi:hypothetical protein
LKPCLKSVPAAIAVFCLPWLTLCDIATEPFGVIFLACQIIVMSATRLTVLTLEQGARATIHPARGLGALVPLQNTLAPGPSCPTAGIKDYILMARPQTEHVRELYRSGTTRITPPVAIDLYDSTLRSTDQPASGTAFAVRVLASLFGLTSPT